MIHRTRRRLIYGAGYLGVLILLASSIYIAVRPEPSCVDGKRNQGETEIDCDGPCADCALRTLQPIQVRGVAYAPAGDFIVAAATIANPNDAYGARALSYALTLYGESDAVVHIVNGTTFIYAGEQKPIVIPISGISLGAVRRAGLSVADPVWERHETFSKPQLGLELNGVEATDDGDRLKISGTLRNPEGQSYASVAIQALLYDDRGRFVGASRTETDVDGFAEKGITLFHPSVENVNADLTVLNYEARR